MNPARGARPLFASLLLLALVLGCWQLATLGKKASPPGDAEYQAMISSQRSGLPGPIEIAQSSWHHLRSPFHDGGANDKGIGIQLAFSIARVLLGFALAMIFAIPLGFVIGTSPLLHRALNPYVQVLKPISRGLWIVFSEILRTLRPP